ncbi:MAG: sensor histidine kinase [Fusobacteriaceae bacterium]
MSEEIAKNYNEDNFQKAFSQIITRFTVIGLDGIVLYDSDLYSKSKQLENHLQRKEVQEALAFNSSFVIRKSETQNEKRAYYATKFKNKLNHTYILRVSQSYKTISKDLYLLILFQIIFFLTLNFSIYRLYKNILKRELFNKIDKVRIFLESDIQSENITSDKNQWLSKLWKIVKLWQLENIENIKKLSVEKRILNTILNSVNMSVLLIDSQYNIILKNNVLNLLFQNSKSNNCLDLIKNVEILNIIKKIDKKDAIIQEKIFLNSLKKHFLVTIKYLKEDDYYLLTIKDISLVQELTDIQKKFISNVSHELKTPLTNIKGYLIALEDAPLDLRNSFLTTINNNVEKFENIIGDFLNMSKLENSNILNYEDVNIKEIKNFLFESLTYLIKKKNATLSFNIKLNNHESILKTDFDKLTLILKNIIENGIIYNNTVIPTIIVSLTESYENYIFTIQDNGLGVPKDKIEKIFERFYRVDESRTTNLSGSGLGLAIVKEAVDKFKGNITIHSELNKGSFFTVIIPKFL